MADDVSDLLRREIRTRANGRCEYCLLDEQILGIPCEVDHIVSRKHGGKTAASNLALCCVRCNRAKGSDVGSISSAGDFVRLFNPRQDHWNDHFELNGTRIAPKSPIGEVTIFLLRLNSNERLLERKLLQAAGRFMP